MCQFTSAGDSATLSYDSNGNLTGDGTWTYGYDGSNRLKSAARTGFSATLYAYVGNDPVNRIDPDGLDTLQVGIAVGGVFLGVGVPQTGAGFAFDTQGNIGGYVSSGVSG